MIKINLPWRRFLSYNAWDNTILELVVGRIYLNFTGITIGKNINLRAIF